MAEELSEKIDELLFWVKYQQWKTFVTDLKATLRDDIDKLVYELSDGKNSTREIADFLTKNGKKITHVSVANMWQKWAAIPLVIEGTRPGRYKRVTPLKDAGILLPSLEQTKFGEKTGDE